MNDSSSTPRTEHILAGPDAANPLGFLAALGALRTLDRAWPTQKVRMYWKPHANSYRAVIHLSGAPESEHSIIQSLAETLESEFDNHPVATVVNAGKTPMDQIFRAFSREATQSNREEADWCSALRSDIAADATSQLQTARKDYFLGNIKNVLSNCTAAHLHRSLFATWDYRDALENQSLHLDPIEDRRYAYQWNQPSGDPDRKKSGGMIGANRLAIEALTCFQSFGERSSDDKLATVGITGKKAHNTRLTWPVWSVALRPQVIGSLLATPELQQHSPDLTMLHAHGVIDLYRSQRILVGKTPNFTPAEII